ncbi:MAG: hypothetical protein FD151_1182 [bacterium]|nr:MAG: hypothetical protein FD151_1182 [bacterium]
MQRTTEYRKTEVNTSDNVRVVSLQARDYTLERQQRSWENYPVL